MKKHAIIKQSGFIYYSAAKKISVPRGTHRYAELLSALLDDNVSDQEFKTLFVSVCSEDVEELSEGKIRKEGDSLVAEAGEDVLVLPIDIQNTVKDLMHRGATYSHLEKFWRRCLANPNRGSVEQLFDFVTRHLLTITEDGHFIAYKAVRSDFWDKYTGHTHLNTPGAEITMPREGVTFDPHQGCSAGLHVANLAYAQGYASGDDVIITVMVDPADVVSVAYECTSQKVRVCRYKVIDVWLDEKSCPSAVVDENMQDCTPPEMTTRTGAWMESEDKAVNALVALMRSNQLRGSAAIKAIKSLADKLRRPEEDIKARVYVLYHPITSNIYRVPQLTTLVKLVWQHGHQWRLITGALKAEHPELGRISEDTVRKTAKRMGL